MTHRLAVFGNPIDHSRSPEIHQAFAAQTGVDLVYERVLVPDGQFEQVATDFLADPEAVGFNITVPCKEEAWRFCSTLADNADQAKAVNTILRTDAGAVSGFNTDGPGLTRDLTENLNWRITGQNVLVLGAGGAVSGVLGDLLAHEPARIDLLNRTSPKAQDLTKRYKNQRLNAISGEQALDGYDLVINGTSAGLQQGLPPMPETAIGPQTCVYDMIYSLDVTRFNRWGLDLGAAAVSDGLGMLVEQAALAFEIWFQQPVTTAPVISQLRQSA